MPSKLYGVMAVGKPVLGVLEKDSEARIIIEESECGLLAEPGDYDIIEKNIQSFIEMDSAKQITMGDNARSYLLKKLTKNVSISKYINEIKSS